LNRHEEPSIYVRLCAIAQGKQHQEKTQASTSPISKRGMTKPGPCDEGGVKSCCPDEGVPGERERTGEGEESVDVCILGEKMGEKMGFAVWEESYGGRDV
jgi:hypothetical protein